MEISVHRTTNPLCGQRFGKRSAKVQPCLGRTDGGDHCAARRISSRPLQAAYPDCPELHFPAVILERQHARLDELRRKLALADGPAI